MRNAVIFNANYMQQAFTSGAQRRIVVLGDGKRVTLGNYVRAVKLAKANPTRRFDRGLTCWHPCTGAEIVGQFRDGLHDRINQRAEVVR